jgi:hypothetical protein
MTRREPGLAENAWAEPISSAWREIKALLENQKAQLYEDLKNYPSPIAACDQQFNHLLDAQADIARELNRLRTDWDENLSLGEAINAIDTFVGSSRWIDADAWQRIRNKLEPLNDGRADERACQVAHGNAVEMPMPRPD